MECAEEIHKTYIRQPLRVVKVLFTFDLRPLSRAMMAG